ncbi:hypothetical protein [Thermococcus gorgonarius]|uniref:Uncharacterized protein n=1 Tax=Thermococcus gorgonarius TaxID=71997 RepID=A0A2Z2M9Z1_THEGO|nr:hypothetical protein [Thermococcus gorgonarius]ASJ00714.1 hypothetical protein A3K92_04095 [Thermococcus gorgonarius]
MQVWYRSRALYDAVMKLISSGKYEDAIKMADEIPNDKVRTMAYARIALKLAENNGNYREVLEKAINSATDLPGDDSTKVLMGMAFDFLNIGKVEDALRIAEYITDLASRSKIQAEVALKLAREGRISEAMEIINDILDEDVKTWAMSRIAGVLQ